MNFFFLPIDWLLKKNTIPIPRAFREVLGTKKECSFSCQCYSFENVPGFANHVTRTDRTFSATVPALMKSIVQRAVCAGGFLKLALALLYPTPLNRPKSTGQTRALGVTNEF